jgi:hypothetical protein
VRPEPRPGEEDAQSKASEWELRRKEALAEAEERLLF